MPDAVAAADRGDDATARRLLETLADGMGGSGLPDHLEDFLRRLADGGSTPDVRAEAGEAFARSRELHGDHKAAREQLQEAFTLAPTAARLRRLTSLTARVAAPPEARTLMEDGLARWPDDVELLALAAGLALDRGAVEEARELLDRAAARDPTHSATLTGLARLAITEGRPEDAVAPARGIVPRFPSLGRALIAIALAGAGHREEDPGVLDAVLADLPSDRWVLTRFAQVLLEGGRAPDAIVVLDHALRFAPGDVNALRTRGYALAVVGDYPKAAADLDRVALVADDSWLNATRGEIARIRGDYPTAVELLGSVPPDEALPWVQTSLGSALSATGDLSRAREAFQRALDHDPDDVDALCDLGQILLEDDDPSSVTVAEEMFDKARKADPEQPRTHALLAEARRRQGRLQEALEGFDQALLLKSDYVYALASKGQTLVGLKDYEAGVDLLTQAVRSAPTTAWILNELVSLLEEHEPGQADSVLRGVQRDVRDDRGDILPLCKGRARLAERQRRWADADQLYSQARRLAPDDQDLAVAQVSVLRALARNEEALQLLDTIAPRPGDDRLRWNRISLLWDLDRLSDARTELEELTAGEDPPAAAAAALGEIHRIEGRRDDARRLLTLAHRKDPDRAYNLASLGALEKDDGHIDVARTLLRDALRAEPGHAFALSTLVNLELDEGNERAVRALLGREQTRNDPALTTLRATSLFDLGEHASAWQVLDNYVAEATQDAAALRARGCVEVALGQSRRAARSFVAAAYLPEAPSGLVNSVWSLTRVDLWEEAMAAVQRAYERKNPYADTALALAWLEAGAWDAAARSAVAGQQRLPLTRDAVYMASHALRMVSRTSEAAVLARQARDLTPADTTTLVNLAECLLLNGEPEQAEAVYTEALDRLARRVYLDAGQINMQGWCLLRIGRFSRATDAFLRALSVTDRASSVLLNLLLASLLEGEPRQTDVLTNRAREELRTLAPASRRGALATAVHDLATLQDQLAPEPRATAQRLAAEFRNTVQELDADLGRLAAETLIDLRDPPDISLRGARPAPGRSGS